MTSRFFRINTNLRAMPLFSHGAGLLLLILCTLPWLMGQGCVPAVPPTTNHSPAADAGSSRTVAAEAPVILNGSSSSDPDGDTLSYAWQQTSGASVTLIGSLTATPSFTAPATSDPIILTFTLTVTDGGGLSDTATVQITVNRADLVPPDADGDGEPDSTDLCPNDGAKVEPGACGCGVSDGDTDHDGTSDCTDGCPSDPAKIAPGTCGCNVAETDTDGDGTPDCHDDCPSDLNKTAPGSCGCGVVDTPGCGTPTPDTLTLDLGGGVTLELVKIPAGTFVMGDDTTTDPWLAQVARPAHGVTISEAFYLGKYEVTQRQWEAVMGDNPAWFATSEGLPVEHVSWEDCQTFCQTLSGRVGRTIELPTEAQWEYACRGGTSTFYSFGNSSDQLANHAWFWDNADSQTHAVG
ncbi:MAG: SUMF1/EgtB/PvdO family nonheme iron enzyme, partial [Phycisphaerae bacterium]|nr:SUMF1/EgtB/PvdO family nonheme iron enzyme [Phycisphaerae bacterium]